MDENGEIWFTEELLPYEPAVEEAAKDLEIQLALGRFRAFPEEMGLDLKALRTAEERRAAIERQVRRQACGILRVHHPRWRPLTPEEAGRLPTGLGDLRAGPLAQGHLYLVRLGMELDIAPEGREAGWAYAVAWCRAYLFSPGSAAQPRVLEVYPQRLYEGERTTVQVEIGLGLKAGPAEAQVGKIGTDLHLGQVQPVTVGFLGEEERSPYWELRAAEHPILGIYHFWMIVEQPEGGGPVRLAVQGEGDLRSHILRIPVGPKERAWRWRPSIPISE